MSFRGEAIKVNSQTLNSNTRSSAAARSSVVRGQNGANGVSSTTSKTPRPKVRLPLQVTEKTNGKSTRLSVVHASAQSDAMNANATNKAHALVVDVLDDDDIPLIVNPSTTHNNQHHHISDDDNSVIEFHIDDLKQEKPMKATKAKDKTIPTKKTTSPAKTKKITTKPTASVAGAAAAGSSARSVASAPEYIDLQSDESSDVDTARPTILSTDEHRATASMLSRQRLPHGQQQLNREAFLASASSSSAAASATRVSPRSTATGARAPTAAVVHQPQPLIEEVEDLDEIEDEDQIQDEIFDEHDLVRGKEMRKQTLSFRAINFVTGSHFLIPFSLFYLCFFVLSLQILKFLEKFLKNFRLLVQM